MNSIPLGLQAGFWGLVAGSSLILGAAIGYMAKLPQRVTAGVMAFGSGVLISALSFELMDEAFRHGGFAATSIGFISGATVYTLANMYLSRKGAKHRKRSGTKKDERQPSEKENAGSGTAIAMGALLDGIPESIVVGLSLLGGKGVSLVTVAAIFLSNVPEGLSSSSGMKKSGRSPKYVFGVWTVICVLSALASVLGATLFKSLPLEWVAATNSFAAGAMLTMIVDTMVPEAFEWTHSFAGLMTVLGFLFSFLLSKMNAG